tara:strand:- start:3497 stop:4261 length:765 start_codon:yes stop_codon:yes gene_type:complete
MLKKICILKCDCGKEYKHIQSFNRHIKKCEIYNKEHLNTDYQNVSKNCTNKSETENIILSNMISSLISQNKDILKENKEMMNIVNDIIPKIGNTTINKFNLNVFLNEECKDALNLSEFINNLQLQINDLDNTREHGYVDGITKIFVRNLRQLEFNKRPIHCSDLKREIIYVKDNNSWAKEYDNKPIIRNAISCVAKRQIDIIKEWEEQNKDWNITEEGTRIYLEMVKNVTGSEGYVSDNKIIKTIAKEVVIDKL